MAFDEDLAERLQALLADEPGLSEKRMFGGLAFLIDGRMAVAAIGEGGLMVRVEPRETQALLRKPHTREMEMSRGPVDGWLQVDAEGIEEDADLRSWVSRGVGYAGSLPKK